MNLKINQNRFIFLILNVLFFIFLYFYSFDFLFSKLNYFFSRFEFLWFYQVCENSINLFSNNDSISYRFTNNLQCVGQVLNDYDDGILYVGVLSESLLNILKISFLFIDLVLFIFIFYLNQLKIVNSKIIIYVEKVNKVFIIWSLLFFNFVYVKFLLLIFSEVEFFNYSKINYFSQVSLQVFLMTLFFIVFYLISKLNNKNIIKFLTLFLFLAYPISNMLLNSYYFIFFFSLIMSYLFIKIGGIENTKKIIFTFLILLTFFNSATAYSQFNENIGNQNSLPNIPNFNQTTSNAEGPILILWFDEFPSYTIFSEELDIRSEYKNLSSLAKQSYIFPFNQSLASSSYESLDLTFSDFELNENVIKNYDIKFIEPISSICPYKSCNYSKKLSNLEYLQDLFAILLNVLDYNFLSNFTPNIDDRFGDFWAEDEKVYEDYWEVDFKTLNSLTTNISKYDFIFAHIFLPHTPWKYFSSGETYSMQPDNRRSFFLEENFIVFEDNMYTTRYEWLKSFENNNFLLDESSRQINQILYLDLLIGEIINNLKNQDLFDSATIIIASDHGINVSKGGSYRSLDDNNYVDILNTPLIIKTPLQNNTQKVLDVVGNDLISDFLKMILYNDSKEEQLKLLTNYSKQPKIKILEWDALLSESDKYQINDGYLTLDKDIFIDKVRKNTKFTTQIFAHIENSYGWSDELEIDLSNLNLLNLNLNDKNLSSSNQYFYLNFSLDTNVKQVIIEIDGQFKYVDTYIYENKTQVTFLLNDLVGPTTLQDIKIYEIKN